MGAQPATVQTHDQPAAKAQLASDSIDGVTANAAQLTAAGDLADAREKFGVLSEAIDAYMTNLHLTPPEGVRVAFCPMVMKPWMQHDGTLRNPYYGRYHWTTIVGKEGLAALTADMLDEGSGGRSAIEMHEAIARIGAQFDTDIGADAALATMTTLARFADRGLALLADMIARPDLTESDFERVRQLRLHRLTQLRDVPSAVADRTFVQLLYGPHPYGHAPMGTEAALASLRVDDVRSFHAQAIRPDQATLVAAGDCDHAHIERIAADAFAGWERAGSAAADEYGEPGLNRTKPTQPARLYVVPRAGAPQSELRIGHVAVARSTSDYHALVAANMVFVQFVPNVERVTTSEVTRVAATHLDPSRLTTLVVGDLDAIAGDLPRLGLGEPIILSAETF